MAWWDGARDRADRSRERGARWGQAGGTRARTDGRCGWGDGVLRCVRAALSLCCTDSVRAWWWQQRHPSGQVSTSMTCTSASGSPRHAPNRVGRSHPHEASPLCGSSLGARPSRTQPPQPVRAGVLAQLLVTMVVDTRPWGEWVVVPFQNSGSMTGTPPPCPAAGVAAPSPNSWAHSRARTRLSMQRGDPQPGASGVSRCQSVSVGGAAGLDVERLQERRPQRMNSMCWGRRVSHQPSPTLKVRFASDGRRPSGCSGVTKLAHFPRGS